MQFNFLREKGAFLYDPATQKFKVNFDKIREAVRDLAAQFLILEGNGNYEEVRQFISHYGNLDKLTLQTIQKLQDIPVDIEPIFKSI